MANKKSHKKLWITLTSITGALTAVLIVGTVVANNFRVSINSYFECDTYKTVKDENASEEDSEYYPDEWEGYDEWFEYYEQDVCERAEGEGAVLLKNDNNALPISSSSSISFFSQSSVDLVYGGTGSGSVDTSTAPTLKEAFESRGFNVNQTLWSFYNTGAGSSYRREVPAIASCSAEGDYVINEVPWSVYTDEVKNSFASYGDAAIFVLGRSGGEGADVARTEALDDGLDGDYLKLTTEEKEVLTQLATLKAQGTFKKIIVLVNSSNTPHCDFLENEEYDIDAALWIAGPGAYGTNSIADIICGNTNPSGRTVDTWLYNNFDNPSLTNFGDFTYTDAAAVGLTDTNDAYQTNVNYVVYQEGIYVGYKYFETRYEDYVIGQGSAGTYNYEDTVYAPFGYGLSYTEWEYSGFSVEETDDTFEVSLTVKNAGDVTGKHSVEIYMQKPYTDYDKDYGIEKSSVELVGFTKTDDIRPGYTENVTISVDKSEMKAYDSYNAKTYIVDEGNYYLTVGSDSHDAANNILAAKGYTPSNTSNRMDADGNAALVYTYEQEDFDDETYSVSEVTGEEITNQFDDTDINLYDGLDEEVTYLSRSDWTGTLDTEGIELKATSKLYTDCLDEWTTPENDAEMPEYGASNGLTMAMMMGLDYDDPAWDDLLDQMSFSEQESLIINGFHSTDAIESISKPATRETNGPSGITNSFINGSSSGMAYPAETIMAATWNKDLLYEIGECIGVQGLKSDTQGVYAPGANIHRNAYCGRNYEYFSEDDFLSGELLAADVEGIQSKGVYVFMKHFALNDQETHRGGIMTWANEQTIRETYLGAFEKGVTEGHAKGAMTVMNRIGYQWGGAHEGLLTDVLRNEWGFDGIVITDYSSNSNYTSHVNGLQAGSDLWDGFSYTETNTPYLNAFESDAYVCQLMRQATHRILYVQVNSSAMNGISSSDRIVTILTWWQTTLIVVDVVLGVLFAGCLVMLILSILKGRKQNSEPAEQN